MFYLKDSCRRVGYSAWLVVLLLPMLAGCAAMEREKVQKTENLLAASGFKVKVADTPEKLAQLKTMTQHRPIRRLQDGRVIYVYADAMDCKCLYHGTQAEYDEYRKLALQAQMARERVDAAEMNQNAAMNWGAWGPWY